MKFPLRAKLVAGFLAVIGITGGVATVVGIVLLGDRIVTEAQNKVTLDLNSAWQVYEQRLRDIEKTVSFTAMKMSASWDEDPSGGREALLDGLQQAMDVGDLDILTITDASGRVLLRARSPHVHGDCQAHDEIVRRVLQDLRPHSATQIVPREDLLLESEALAERAHMVFIPTPRARPTRETESTSGMMLKAAAPVLREDGGLVGVLYGGVLLNRDYEIVDRTKEIAYGDAQYEGRDIGTVTIFQKDLRISTNVKQEDGSRAIRTRVSQEVYDRVIGEGKSWKAPAFVVNDWYLTAYEPIRNIAGEVIGILYVGILEARYDDMRLTATLSFLGITVAGMLLALGVAYFLARGMVKPIHDLKRGVEAIAAGDFDVTVNVTTADEIGALASSFNRVRQELRDTYEKLHGKIEAADEVLKKAYQELQEKQRQLIHAEKLASLGSLAAGVAHEINNPLGTISLYSQLTLDELAPDQESCRENLEVVMKHASRAAGIVKNLLEFARRTDLEVGPVDVNLLLDNVLAMTAHHARLQDVSLSKNLGDGLPAIVGDEDKLRQVFINIVINAIQAMPEGGELSVDSETAAEGRTVVVRIRDSGCGISAENLEKIFDPFFTTKASGKGTGLGLAVSLGIIEQHRGRISVESQPGQGTTFIVELPAQGSEPS